MRCKDNRVWDEQATKSSKVVPPEWFTYYMRESYRRATKIGIRYVSVNTNNVNLLKTDLWNEGVATGRDILSQYQGDGDLNLYGVDISSITCSAAKKRIKRTSIIQGDIRNLPFEDSCFDIILDLSTLDHIPPHQVKSVIQEYKRTLRKDGILLLIFWYDSALLRLIFKLRKIDYKRQPAKGTQYYFPISVLKDDIKKQFNILEEFCTASLLNINNRITAPIIRNFPIAVYDLILNVEYSKISKYLLKALAGLCVIIAKKKQKDIILS